MDQRDKPSTPPESVRGEGLDFELTDIDEARRILDEESISQFDVASVARPEHWKRLRRANLPTDRALTGRAIDWLLALPPTLRPQSLSHHFPRIVNALADVWYEPEQCRAAFDRLLRDDRRGRQGFPAAVHDELVAMRRWKELL
ncbi:MAG: hypothetical protein ABI520_07175 [Caldimonas sp.]